jgi:hypothetical protein
MNTAIEEMLGFGPAFAHPEFMGPGFRRDDGDDQTTASRFSN